MTTKRAAGIIFRATAKTLLPRPLLRVATHRLGHMRQQGAILRTYNFPINQPLRYVNYLLFNPEIDNFTYDISNRDELVLFLAEQFDTPVDRIRSLLQEIDDDYELADKLKKTLKRPALFGRRLAWYVIVRLIRPRLIVETGVHDGLGSVCLLQALKKNSPEGIEGQLLGIDIKTEAGWLIPTDLRLRLNLSISDSAQALQDLAPDIAVDLFIHDSDHRYEHEMLEYNLIESHLSANAIVLSDNSHADTALQDFAAKTGRKFAFWQERSKNHFYPGAGVGISRK